MNQVEGNIKKGIACIFLAGIGFSLMTFFVRLSGDLPTMQKTFFRNFVALIIATISLLKTQEKFYIKRASFKDIFWRCAFGTSGMICNFYAIDHLEIADANMLNKMSPFYAVLLSIPLLKEKPNYVDIISTVVAFIGAMFIVRPSGNNISLIPSLIGLYGGIGAGAAYVFVRRLGRIKERTSVIVFCFSAFSCLVTLPFLLIDYHAMSFRQIGCLLLAGSCAALGQFSITSAYKYAPAKELSVFDYIQVIFATLWGLIFLHELPHRLSFVGYFIIIATSIFRWYYTKERDKREKNMQKVS